MPSKQYYFKLCSQEVLADADLKEVSLEAVGLWIKLLCLMHQSPRMGYLIKKNGQPFHAADVARHCGLASTPEEVRNLIQELVSSGVLSCSEHGVVYCRRMVKDAQISEVRSAAGRKGADKVNFAAAKSSANSRQDDRQTERQHCNYNSNSVSDFNSSERDGGAGEGRDFWPIFEETPEGIAQEWRFHQHPKKACACCGEVSVGQELASMAAAGFDLQTVIAEVRRQGRDRSEHFWQLKKRLCEVKKPSSGELNAKLRQKIAAMEEKLNDT